ncbi:MAG TPA: DHH family phosphoesterase [Candidatus Nanopusillus sp.]|nr:DHH family phosphoesterase [Candidatus Nanopusillus sp.]
MIYKKIANTIKKIDNALVVTDNDPDGISAAILMKVILNRLGKEYGIVVRDHRKLDNLRDIIKNHSSYSSYIFLDSPFPDKDLIEMATNYKDRVFIYIDHHKRAIPEELPENLKYYDIRALGMEIGSTAGIAYKVGKNLFKNDFKRYSIIAMIGAIGDWMVDEDILEDFNSEYKNRFVQNKIFLYPTFILFNTFLFGNSKELVENGELLIDNPYAFFSSIDYDFISKRIKSFYKKIANLEKIYESEKLLVFKSKGTISIIASFIHVLYPSKILIIVSNTADNFLEKIFPRKYKVSVRCSLEKMDVGKLMSEFTSRYGIYGGGHPAAAGGKIWIKDLGKLIEFLESRI